MKRYFLDASELATVLAALRHWQADLSLAEQDAAQPPPEHPAALHFWPIATNEGTVEPLTVDEIDALCERLNFEDEAQ